MKVTSQKLMVLMLLIVIFAPLYLWIVQVVNASPPRRLVKSLSLRGGVEKDFECFSRGRHIVGCYGVRFG